MARLCGQSDVGTSLGAISSICNSVGQLATNHLRVPAGNLSNPTTSLRSKECAEGPARSLLGIQLVSQPNEVETFYACSTYRKRSRQACGFMSKRYVSTCPLCDKDSVQPFIVPTDLSTLGSALVVEYPYIVTDDLQIMPASAGKAFDLLRSSNVVSMDEVESDVVEVSQDQVPFVVTEFSQLWTKLFMCDCRLSSSR